MAKVNRAWFICGACALLMFCTMGLCSTSFALYNPYLQKAGGLTNAQVSIVSTVRTVFGILGLIAVTRVNRRLGVRRSALLSSAGCASALVIFALGGGFAAYCAASALSGFSYAIGGMVMVSVIISNWFTSHRGIALGICSSGGGLASVVAPPAAAAVICVTSMTASLLAEGAVVLAAGIFVSLVLRKSPQDLGLEPLDEPQQSRRVLSAKHAVGLSAPGRLRMAAAMALFGVTCGPAFSHLSMLMRSAGYDEMRTALFLSLQGAALTVGKLAFGSLSDRFGTRRASALLYLFDLGAFVCLCLSGRSFAFAAAGAALLGAGTPLSTVGVPLFAADLSAPSQFLSSLRIYNIAVSLGAVVTGPLPGILADTLGSYVPFYAFAGICTAGSMALVLHAYREAQRLALPAPRPAGGRAAGL